MSSRTYGNGGVVVQHLCSVLGINTTALDVPLDALCLFARNQPTAHASAGIIRRDRQ